MSCQISELSFDGVTNVNILFDFIETKHINSISVMLFVNNQTDLVLNWSPDGINTDLQETITILAGTAQHIARPIKSSYFSLTLTLSAAPTTVRLDTLFFLSKNNHSLENVGSGAEVLIQNEGKIRSVISSDGSVTITEDPLEIDITSGGGGSIWQEVSNVISPVTASTHGLLTGNLNTIVQTEGMTNCVIVGGLSNTMDQIYSTNPVHFLDNDAILGGESNEMGGKAITNSVLVGGDTNKIETTNLSWGINDSTIIGGKDNLIYSSQNNCDNSCILGGKNNRLEANDCAIIAGNGHTINQNEYGAIIGGGSPITLVTHGGFTFTCSGGGIPFIPGNNNACEMRFSGGFRYYSSNSKGTGMTMDAGLSAWSPVSDVNMKNIHKEVDYLSYLDRMRSIDIFEYSYKSCCTANRNIGPIAQQWHNKSNFRTPDYITAKLEKNEEGSEVEVLDEEGKPVMENRGPYKDPLRVCQGDQHGVALACIRALIIEVDKLKSRIEVLEGLVV